MITDYSEASVTSFREFLRSRFASVRALECPRWALLFARLKTYSPPGRDIRKERLNHFFEHLDAFARAAFL